MVFLIINKMDINEATLTDLDGPTWKTTIAKLSKIKDTTTGNNLVHNIITYSDGPLRRSRLLKIALLDQKLFYAPNKKGHIPLFMLEGENDDLQQPLQVTPPWGTPFLWTVINWADKGFLYDNMSFYDLMEENSVDDTRKTNRLRLEKILKVLAHQTEARDIHQVAYNMFNQLNEDEKRTEVYNNGTLNLEVLVILKKALHECHKKELEENKEKLWLNHTSEAYNMHESFKLFEHLDSIIIKLKGLWTLQKSHPPKTSNDLQLTLKTFDLRRREYNVFSTLHQMPLDKPLKLNLVCARSGTELSVLDLNIKDEEKVKQIDSYDFPDMTLRPIPPLKSVFEQTLDKDTSNQLTLFSLSRNSFRITNPNINHDFDVWLIISGSCQRALYICPCNEINTKKESFTVEHFLCDKTYTKLMKIAYVQNDGEDKIILEHC